MEGQALAGKDSLRGSEAPAWPLGRAERRSGEHWRCRGGSAAGGGGAGPRRLLFSAPLGLGPPPSSPVPYTLHPLLLLPSSDSCFTSPPLGPQEPAAHSEDGGGSAGSSGCGIQYGGRESGRATRRSAAPASAPPGDWTARAREAARKPSSERGPERRRPEVPLRSAREQPAPRPLPAPCRRGSERCGLVGRLGRPLEAPCKALL